MTVIVGTLIFAVIMIVITKFPVALAMKKQFGRYDNEEPREQERKLTGFGRRAMGAHENTIEAFPIFASGALLAAMTAPTAQWTYILCFTFIAARILYTLFYWYNLDKLRSISWAIGLFSSLGLMALAL